MTLTSQEEEEMGSKSKFFWAARDYTVGTIWDYRGVSLFPASKKPRMIAGKWADTSDIQGGMLCYGIFTRLTGVRLKPGQVKIVYLPSTPFRAYKVDTKPEGSET